MRRESVSRLFALVVAVATLLIAAAAPALAAPMKTMTVDVVVAGSTSCDFTVSASWDNKGGPVEYAQMYVWTWDEVQQTYGPDFWWALSVTPDTRNSATYTFTGLNTGDYRVNVFLWKNGTTEVGTYYGVYDGPNYSCPGP
jgi:uncharacterized protein (DUF2141 family)